MFSNAHTNCMYSDSPARAHVTLCLLDRVQSPKQEEIFAETVSLSVAQSHFYGFLQNTDKTHRIFCWSAILSRFCGRETREDDDCPI